MAYFDLGFKRQLARFVSKPQREQAQRYPRATRHLSHKIVTFQQEHLDFRLQHLVSAET